MAAVLGKARKGYLAFMSKRGKIKKEFFFNENHETERRAALTQSLGQVLTPKLLIFLPIQAQHKFRQIQVINRFGQIQAS